MLDDLKDYYKNLPLTVDRCMCFVAGLSLTGAFAYFVYSLVNPDQ